MSGSVKALLTAQLLLASQRLSFPNGEFSACEIQDYPPKQENDIKTTGSKHLGIR